MNKFSYALAILLFLLLNFFLVHTVASQSKNPMKPDTETWGEIKGIIKDKDTEKPIEGDIIIVVRFLGTDEKTVSFNGSANLYKKFISKAPTILLSVEKEGYMPHKEIFQVKKVIEANVSLEKMPAKRGENMSTFHIITIIAFICLFVYAIYQKIARKKQDSISKKPLHMNQLKEEAQCKPPSNKQATNLADNASVPSYHQPTPEIKKAIASISKTDWDYCQNCGKKGSKQFNIFSKKYSFCSQPCCDDFGNRLYYVSGKVFCPYCGAGQPLTKGSPRICGSCSGNMDELPEKIIGTQLDSKLSQCIQVLEEAEKNLSQSNSPEYEIGLYSRLLESPGDAIKAIKKRSWARRGTGPEDANRFCLRVLETIYKSYKEKEKTDAVSEIVNIFKMQDDNTSGWLNIVDLACKILDQNKILEAKPELIEIEINATGKNKQAINFALQLLNKQSATKINAHQERFVDNGNGTITDTKTGLMWQKEDDGQKRTLRDSEDYCKNLTIGGHRDWRLPTIDELSSLSKDWQKIFAGPKDDDPYWSNTVLKNPHSNHESQKYAAKVMFFDGQMNQFFIIYEYYARAVRKL
jgi:predicted negative regulator of RcsB-dependent stress response